MRYAIFADVHSNIEAFQVVIEAYYQENVDRYLFLGDIIGYGGDPRECLDVLKDLKAITVAGNHDWAAVGKFPLNNLNLHARTAINWTKTKLTKADVSYLSGFHLTIEEKDFVCVHGSLRSPHEFKYILDIDDAVTVFQLFKKKVCFLGHSHRPGIYCLDKDNVSYIEPGEVTFKPDNRYIVNVGSVGQPRDGDPRASFCVYDDEDQRVEIFRVGYDVAKAASSIVNQNLPSNLANRLYDGR
ncbi:MAG: metallophosphatase family protein [Candidatus Omnitrophica bacterium]|nr:metallophosphatase family protein [Candidatus Omnitrophota bacterium]